MFRVPQTADPFVEESLRPENVQLVMEVVVWVVEEYGVSITRDAVRETGEVMEEGVKRKPSNTRVPFV